MDFIDEVDFSIHQSYTESSLDLNYIFEKKCDKKYSYPSDILTYVITVIKNKSSIDFKSLTVIDTIPEGATLINGSLKVNNIEVQNQVLNPEFDNYINISIDNSTNSNEFNITYDIKINQYYENNPLPSSISSSSYGVFIFSNESKEEETITSTTAPLTTFLNYAYFKVEKSAPKFIDLKTNLEHTIKITNLGNTIGNFLSAVEQIPQDTFYIDNSFNINGEYSNFAPDFSNIPINNLSPGKSITISYSLRISEDTQLKFISSIFNTEYRYIYDEDNKFYVDASAQSTTTTKLNYAKLNVNIEVDKTMANLNDNLDYTVTIKNIGTVAARKISVTNLNIPFTNFVPYSIKVNGVPYSTLANLDGFYFQNIPSEDTLTFEFSVSLSQIPTDSIISASCIISCKYIIDITKPYALENSPEYLAQSDTVYTTIAQLISPTYTFSINKNYVKSTDTLSCTISFINNDIYTLSTVKLETPTPDEITLIAESIEINYINKEDVKTTNLEKLTIFQATNVPSGAKIIINFNVNVNANAPKARIEMTSSSSYTYSFNPHSIINIPPIANVILVRHPKITLIKLVDSDEKLIGDTINYTLELTNSGNILTKNVILSDTLQDNLILIPNSITVDNEISQFQGLENLNLGDFEPTKSKTIKFQATINSKPTNNEIINSALASYKYIVDPITNLESEDISSSNKVTIKILDSPDVIFTKSVDKNVAYEGNELTYTLNLRNNKIEDISNIQIIATIPQSTTLVKGSATLNDIELISQSNPLLALKDIMKTSEKLTLKYKVIINENLNNISLISSKDFVNYNFINSSGTAQNISLTSNEALTNVLAKPKLTIDYKVVVYGLEKSEFCYTRSTLQYTLLIQNNSNVDIHNIFITGPTPNNATLIADSIFLNNAPQSYDGFNISCKLDTLPIGQVITFTFKVIVDEYSSFFNSETNINSFLKIAYNTIENNITVTHNQLTDTLTKTVLMPLPISLDKTVDKSEAMEGDTLVYSLKAKNTTGKNLEFLNIIDTIPENCILVPNSLFVNGKPKITTGNVLEASFKDIPMEEIFDINYTIHITKTSNIISKITNTAYSSYKFANISHNLLTHTSNTVTTNINSTKLNLKLTVSTDNAFIYDILKYTLEITNTGNVNIGSLSISVALPHELSIDENSIKGPLVYNSSISENTLTINLNSINSNTKTLIELEGQVLDIPSSNILIFSPIIKYKYEISPSIQNKEYEVSPYIENKEYETVAFNEVSTNISNLPQPIFTKTSTPKYGNKNTEFQYTLIFNNITNRILAIVEILDEIDTNFYIVPNSVLLDDSLIPFEGNNIKIPIENVKPNSLHYLKYSVSMLNKNNLTIKNLYNQSKASYSFENYKSKTFEITTEKNAVYIRYAYLTVENSVNKSTAVTNDILDYVIELQNIGNISALEVYVNITIDKNVSFIPDSILINHIKPTDNISLDKIPVGVIDVGVITTIKFKVSVNTFTTSKLISSYAVINFKYQIDPSSPLNTDATITSKFKETILLENNPLSFNMSVNNRYIAINDKAIYIVKLENNSSSSINNIYVVDTIPNLLRLDSSSIKTDKGTVSVDNSTLNVFIPSLDSNEEIAIQYKVFISDFSPLVNKIDNIAYCSYSISSTETIPTSLETNVSSIYIRQDKLLIENYVNKTTAELNDILTYTINIINVGNIPVTEVFLSNILPFGTDFITGSLVVNGVPEEDKSPTEISLNTLDYKGSASVSLKLKVEFIPDSGILEFFTESEYSYIKNLDTNILIPKLISSNKLIVKLTSTPKVTITQSVDREYADIGDELNYNIIITNNSETSIINNNISNKLSENLEFIPGSIIINNSSSNKALSQLDLPDLEPKKDIVVSFTAKVIISNNIIIPEIFNIPTLTYSFIDSDGSKITKVIAGDTSYTKLYNASLQIVKTAKKTIVNIGDIQEYNIEITNIGTTNAINTVLNDSLPESLTLDSSSISVDNTIINLPNLINLNIDTIPPNTKKSIYFKALVTTLPYTSSKTISNTCNLEYKYITTPNGNTTKTNIVYSNTSITTIETLPNITFNKIVDKEFADINDDLLYTLILTNNSDKQIIDISLLDYTPINTTFNINSSLVNGQSSSPEGPLPNLLPMESLSISYTVKITGSPDEFNEISNTSKFKYYFVDNLKNLQENFITSDVKTFVNNASLYIEKNVNVDIAFLNDILTYEITVYNYGNVEATSLTLDEDIPSYLSLIPNSLKLNKQPLPSTTLKNVNLGSLKPKNINVISYELQLTSDSISTKISNIAEFNYEYKVSPTRVEQKTSSSNPVYTPISPEPLVVITKSVNKSFCTDNDQLDYNLKVINKGNLPIYILNIMDDIPKLTSYVDNSLMVDDKKKELIDGKINITLQNIISNKPINISYSTIYKISDIDKDTKITNEATAFYNLTSAVNSSFIQVNITPVTVLIKNCILKVIKTVDKKAANLNDILTYTIIILNKGNTTPHNINLSDDILQYATFVEDSLTINKTPILNYSNLSSIDIAPIDSNKETTISFKVKITRIPANNKISSQATVKYKFNVSPTKIQNRTEVSSIIETLIEVDPIVTLNITVDKTLVSKLEELTYTVTLKNEGSKPIFNGIITDYIPDNTKRSSGVLFLNGKAIINNQRIIVIPIYSLQPQKEAVISYSVIAQDCNCNTITNSAETDFNYIDNDGKLIYKTITSNEVVSNISFASIEAKKTSSKSRASFRNIIDFTVLITNKGDCVAKDVSFSDNLPWVLQLVRNSLHINKKPILGRPSLSSIHLGDIEPKTQILITYSTMVIFYPDLRRVQNNAKINFYYSLCNQNKISSMALASPNNEVLIEDSTLSNPVIINIDAISPKLTINKLVDKSIAYPGDILTYTINIKNVGNVEVTDITLIDNLQNELIFEKNSLIIDGDMLDLTLSSSGISLRSLQPNGSITVIFKALVNSSSKTIISNICTVKYSALNDANRTINFENTSSKIDTTIITSSSIEKPLSYADYNLQTITRLYGCKKLHLNKVIIRGENISDLNNTIKLAKNCNFNIKYIIILKTSAGYNGFKSALGLNNLLIPNSIRLEKTYNKSSKLTTLNCQILVNTKEDTNYLDLIYCSVSDNPMYIISASLNIIEIK